MAENPVIEDTIDVFTEKQTFYREDAKRTKKNNNARRKVEPSWERLQSFEFIFKNPGILRVFAVRNVFCGAVIENIIRFDPYEEFMKKVIPILLAWLLTACSALPSFPFFQTPTSAPVVINSPQPTVTLISAGYTNTPDLFATNTEGPSATPQTGTPLVTNTPVPTFTVTIPPTITLEPVDASLFTPSPDLFPLVQRSTDQLVWGSTCDGSRSIKFIVNVTPVLRLKYVLLFIRLQDKYSARHTEWGAGAIMSDNDRGTYFYTIELDQIQDYRFYEDAWLQYQFVASTVYLKVLGRSKVDRTSVSLTHCKVFNP